MQADNLPNGNVNHFAPGGGLPNGNVDHVQMLDGFAPGMFGGPGRGGLPNGNVNHFAPGRGGNIPNGNVNHVQMLDGFAPGMFGGPVAGRGRGIGQQNFNPGQNFNHVLNHNPNNPGHNPNNPGHNPGNNNHVNNNPIPEQHFVIDLMQEVLNNDFYIRVINTSKRSQLKIMNILPGRNIPAEVHDADQFIYIISGSGIALLNTIVYQLHEGMSLSIPAGVGHYIENNSDTVLKLFSLYSPPQYPDDYFED